MNSRVLITGASGFIGHHVERLIGAKLAGLDVVRAGRNEALHLDLAAPQVHLPHGIDTVVHMAGEKRNAAMMQTVNFDGTAKLVEAAARAGVSSFVHLSSVGVYGAPKHADIVDTFSAHVPQGPYEISKDAAERLVRERCNALGLRCVVLQPSNVLGYVEGRHRPLLGLVRMVAKGWFRYVGTQSAWVNYVAVEDVAEALVAATLHPSLEGTFILNTPATLEDFVTWMSNELQVPAPQARLPYWLGALAAGAGAAGGAILGRELPMSPSRLRELTNTTRYDGREIERALTFSYPTGIEAAVRNLVQQYRQAGLV